MRIAQVDLRAEQIGRRAAVDLGVLGDVRATLEALLPRLEEKHQRRNEAIIATALIWLTFIALSATKWWGG